MSVGSHFIHDLGPGFLNSSFSTGPPVNGLVWDSDPPDNAVINVPDATAFSFTAGSGDDEPCSFFGRINMRDATQFRIVSKYSGAGNREWALFMTGGDKLQMGFYDALDRQVAVQSDDTLTGLENQLISVCGTYDGSNGFAGINQYINGLPIDVTDASSGTYTGMDNFDCIVRIGRLDGLNSADGQISQLHVIAGELSAAEVLTLHNTGVSALGDVAFWTLDGDADDSSGNGHDGTNVDGTFVPPA